jgi:hypothetical protein
MPSCKLIIEDEVNIKLEGLSVDIRRKLSNALKYELPYAKHMPQYKLGRWDGKVGFFGIGGSGFVNHLDTITSVLESNKITISEIVDKRDYFELNFQEIQEDFWGDTCWPKGHPAEGEPIRLRDYQVSVINNFLRTPQALQEVATGAGKCRTYDSKILIEVDNNDFAAFLLNKK